MIPPRPDRLVQWWFDGWARRAMGRQFYRLHRWGGPVTATTRPRLYLANHTSFWDGIVLWRLLHRVHPGLLCMVDERQMREHPFFARLGCFSVDRQRPRRALESLGYAESRLAEPGAAVVIFPQGQIEPADRRPLRVERGVGRLVAAARPDVVTVGLRYDWWQEQRAEILVDVAEPVVVEGEAREVAATVAGRLTAQLDALAQRSRDYAVAPYVERVGHASISRWKDRFVRAGTSGK